VKLSRADEIEVNFTSTHRGNTRFAANQMATSGGVSDTTVIIQSNYGAKHAVVTTNDLADESIERAVRQSEALAKLAPEDPENMPRLGAQTYRPTSAYFESTATLTPADRARAALTALDVARRSGDIQAAGFIVTQSSVTGLGNSHGLFAFHPSTSANYTLTVRTADGTGSGWAGADHPDWTQLDVEGVSRRATEKARLSRKPVAIEPGRYTVVLEPQAVGDLVQLVGFYANARTTDEGRSPFTKPGGGSKIGEKIVDERVTLLSDPADPQLLSAPFDNEGMPLNRQVWVEKGVLKQLV
jgi:predicted Zn-dependent protease